MAIFADVITVLLPIAYALFFIYLILKMPVFGRFKIKRSVMIFVFLLKLACGSLFLWLYDGQFEDRHKADVYKFFDDSAVIHEVAIENPEAYFQLMLGYGNEEDLHDYHDDMENWIRQYDHGFANDNRFMIRYNALLRWVSMGNVWVHMVITNFIIFWALVLLVLALTREEAHAWMLFLGLLLPSLLFWSSGVLKETLALIGISCILYGLSRLQKMNVRAVIVICIGLLVLINIKVYLLLFLLMSISVYLIHMNRTGLVSNLKKYSIFLGVLTIFVLAAVKTDLGHEKMQAIAFKQQDFRNIARGGVICKNDTAYIYIPDERREICSIEGDEVIIEKGASFSYLPLPNTEDTLHVTNYKGNARYKLVFENKKSGSMVYIPALDDHVMSFLKAAPFAFYNTLLRPWPFEFKSLLLNLASVEMVVVILLIITSIFYRKKKADIHWNKVLASLLFILTVYYLIGISTPVLGAIVRYKVPVLPFVLYFCYLIIDWNKVGQTKAMLWLRSFVLQEQHQV